MPSADISRGPAGDAVGLDAFNLGEELAIGGRVVNSRFSANTVASLYHSAEGRVTSRVDDILELSNGSRLRLVPTAVANGAGSKAPADIGVGDLVQATVWLAPGTNDATVINVGVIG